MTARACTSCGEPLSALARFCTRCGTAQPDETTTTGVPVPPAGPAQPPRRRTSPLAIAALVLAIVSYPLWFAGFVTAPLAVVFAMLARHAAISRPTEVSGSGLALAGMIAGITWMGLASTIVFTLLVVA